MAKCQRCDGTGRAQYQNINFKCPKCVGRGDTTKPVCKWCLKDMVIRLHPHSPHYWGEDMVWDWECPDIARGFQCSGVSNLESPPPRPHNICPLCYSHATEKSFPNWDDYICNHCGHEFNGHNG